MKTLRPVLFFLACALAGIGYAVAVGLVQDARGDDKSPPAKPTTGTVPTNGLVWRTQANYAFTLPSSITIDTAKGWIDISLKDGSVKLPDGMKLDEASAAFWKGVAEAYPEVRQTILSEYAAEVYLRDHPRK